MDHPVRIEPLFGPGIGNNLDADEAARPRRRPRHIGECGAEPRPAAGRRGVSTWSSRLSRSMIVCTATPAAEAADVRWNVLRVCRCCEPRPALHGVNPNRALHRAAHNRPQDLLLTLMISGTMPSCSSARHVPVRPEPHMTSSAITARPSSQMSRTPFASPRGRTPRRQRRRAGSKMQAATLPARLEDLALKLAAQCAAS